jgi:membrane protein
MIDHDGIEHAGYMSFMMILSIFPFLIFMLSFTHFLGVKELGEELIHLLSNSMQRHWLDFLNTRITELGNSPPQSLMNLAIIGTVWTASSFVECLRTILNRIYEISTPPNYFLRRMLSILQFIIISIIISVAMFALIIIPILLTKVPALMIIMHGYESIIDRWREVLILFLLFSTTAALYYIIPNVKVRFIDVTPGALLTVFLWWISGYLLSSYISDYKQLSIIYGSIAGIIASMVFFYIINMIFIYGAEFNYLLQKEREISAHPSHDQE